MSESIEETVSAILAAGGFAPMPAGEMKGLLCKECAGGYWMGGVHANGVFSKHTCMSPDTTYDPVQAAHELVAHVSRPKTAEEIGRAYSDANDLALYSEPAHDSATAENAGDGGDHVADLTASEDHDPEAVPDQVEALAQDDSVEPEAFEQLETLDASEPREPEASFMELSSEILDADFTEPTDPPPEDHPSGAFIFGDNLPQMRTSAIGLVVQISLAKQEAIWTEAGAGPDEYSQLMSAVVRDTVDGTYKGDQATYDRFVALSTYDNAARRVQAYERDLVNMLTTADRETIETFDPAAGWPA